MATIPPPHWGPQNEGLGQLHFGGLSAGDHFTRPFPSIFAFPKQFITSTHTCDAEKKGGACGATGQ